jgi:hypothetical protein
VAVAVVDTQPALVNKRVELVVLVLSLLKSHQEIQQHLPAA